jgi:hypothetical protein
MKTAAIPGFTAELSLRGVSSRNIWHYARSHSGEYLQESRIIPQLPLGVGVSSAECAKRANDCTNNCTPGDSNCRDICDCYFWCCITGGGGGCLRQTAEFFAPSFSFRASRY